MIHSISDNAMIATLLGSQVVAPAKSGARPYGASDADRPRQAKADVPRGSDTLELSSGALGQGRVAEVGGTTSAAATSGTGGAAAAKAGQVEQETAAEDAREGTEEGGTKSGATSVANVANESSLSTQPGAIMDMVA